MKTQQKSYKKSKAFNFNTFIVDYGFRETERQIEEELEERKIYHKIRQQAVLLFLHMNDSA